MTDVYATATALVAKADSLSLGTRLVALRRELDELRDAVTVHDAIGQYAVETFDWQLDTPVDQIIGEAIGAASMCWEHPEAAGVFESELAGALVEAVMTALRRKLWAD